MVLESHWERSVVLDVGVGHYLASLVRQRDDKVSGLVGQIIVLEREERCSKIVKAQTSNFIM